MANGSVVYWIISSWSCTLELTRGWFNFSTIELVKPWLGIRMPTSFLLDPKSLETWLLACKINVKGPGMAFLITLNMLLSMGFV